MRDHRTFSMGDKDTISVHITQDTTRPASLPMLKDYVPIGFIMPEVELTSILSEQIGLEIDRPMVPHTTDE